MVLNRPLRPTMIQESWVNQSLFPYLDHKFSSTSSHSPKAGPPPIHQQLLLSLSQLPAI